MLPVRISQSLNLQFGAFTVLVFHPVFLSLIHSCRGQHQVVGSSQPIVAMVGEDVILPCYLHPVMDAFNMFLEWGRPNLSPRFVLVWRGSVELKSIKHPSYKGRTSLFTDQLKQGNISLKLSKVKLSDEGRYRFFSPQLGETTVQLIVGAVSSPVIHMITNRRRVVLQCESKGWYPEPEVVWLDGEGNLLSAGPTETVRGPDDLYTVSSRVTVEKRHSNNFTCRVQQKDINQTRETHIYVPGRSGSSSSARNIIRLVVGIMLALAVVFLVKKISNKKHHNDKESQSGRQTDRPLTEGDKSQEERGTKPNNERRDPLNPTERQTENNLQTEEEEEKIKFTDSNTGAQCLMEEEKHEEQLMAERQTSNNVDEEQTGLQNQTVEETHQKESDSALCVVN